VRSAKGYQYLALLDRSQGQRTRFSTTVSANETIAATAFDAQMGTAQDLEPGGAVLSTFAFRSGRIGSIGILSA
jgi:hypothetical protein